MIKLKDILKIMPQPCEFYLYISGEYGNHDSTRDDAVYVLCTAFDFGNFNFYHKRDQERYPREKRIEFLEYEVFCICTYVADLNFSDGTQWRYDDKHNCMHHFFIQIAKPVKRGKKAE